MLVEKIIAAPPPRRERGPASRLRSALLELAGGHGLVLFHGETAWASITFSGKRHSVRLAFEGVEAAEAGERLVAALPDHEFHIPGQLVADATVSEVDHRLLPDERLELLIEVLMLDEG